MVILCFTSSSVMPSMGYSQVEHVWLNCNPKQGTATVPKQKPKVFTNMSKPLPSGTAFSLSQTMWQKFCADLHPIQFHWDPLLKHSANQENVPVCPSPRVLSLTQPILQKSSPCDSSSSWFATTAHSHSKAWELPLINQCRNSFLSHFLWHSAGTDSLSLTNNLSCLLCTKRYELKWQGRFVLKTKINK